MLPPQTSYIVLGYRTICCCKLSSCEEAYLLTQGIQGSATRSELVGDIKVHTFSHLSCSLKFLGIYIICRQFGILGYGSDTRIETPPPLKKMDRWIDAFFSSSLVIFPSILESWDGMHMCSSGVLIIVGIPWQQVLPVWACISLHTVIQHQSAINAKKISLLSSLFCCSTCTLFIFTSV